MINIIVFVVFSFVSELVGSLYLLVIFVPSIVVGWLRVQDLGKPVWYSLIPYYNLYLYCLKGNMGANKYGEDPKNQK